ncbi:MAG: hypothetical protein M1168_00080 [Candidatus Marsarchaeota archaeon]|nr:hypothetical protein [Candidatus Marsarchaeota archaeon]MCL5094370.1 hypothetical protein [Candidatus Marsarchaeota archaeon]
MISSTKTFQNYEGKEELRNQLILKNKNLKTFLMNMAELTQNKEYLEKLVRTNDPFIKLVAMFNPLVTNEISNKLDELKKDKNEIIRYDAEYIETQQMIMLEAQNIDSIADKKQDEENKSTALLKFKRKYSIN